jgi:hypothetical protein
VPHDWSTQFTRIIELDRSPRLGPRPPERGVCAALAQIVPHPAPGWTLFAARRNGRIRGTDTAATSTDDLERTVTEMLLVAVGTLSHVIVGMLLYALGRRHGARRRPPQRVRVPLPRRELTTVATTGRHERRP